MNKVNRIALTASVAAVAIALVPGCSTPTIPVTMKVAGEVKLTGVSKIALVDFNTLPNDPFTGKTAADRETCDLVQRTVASAFYKTPTYQIVDLSAEGDIADARNVLPDKRFDAIVYGRVWWQMTPETDGEYLKKFTLESWENVPYKQKVLGREVPAIAKVTTQTKDVVGALKYRAQSATLMLSLAFYRVDGNGNVSKIVDVYQVAENGFTLMNGDMRVDESEIGMKNDGAVQRLRKTGNDVEKKTAYEEMFPESDGLLAGALGSAAGNAAGPSDKKSKVDANGKVVLSRENVTMPTELQAKLMLAAKLSGDVAAKIAPTEVSFETPWVDRSVLGLFDKRFDARLTELLKNRAWSATRDYAAYVIRRKLGKTLSEKIASIEDVAASYPIMESEESFDDDETEDMIEYFADEKIDVYLYALGIAQEATGKTFEALDAYTEAFNIKPSRETALGISRCNMAIGQSKRVNETNKEKNKAEKKAKLD